ncbi:hypothetical protein ES702_00718 [subsurface metagenome]
MKTIQKKYNIMLAGKIGNGMSYRDEDLYTVRNNADFNRMDMSKSQRKKHHRKLKLGKRDWYKQIQKELLEDIENCR